MGRKKKKASKPWCWYPFQINQMKILQFSFRLYVCAASLAKKICIYSRTHTYLCIYIMTSVVVGNAEKPQKNLVLSLTHITN